MHRSSLHSLCLTSPSDRSARPLTQGARRHARTSRQSSCEARREPPRHQAAAEPVGVHHLRDSIAAELAGAPLPRWPPALGAPLHAAAPSDSRSSLRPAPTRLKDASVPGTARRGPTLPAPLLRKIEQRELVPSSSSAGVHTSSRGGRGRLHGQGRRRRGGCCARTRGGKSVTVCSV
jgi:hypothetical protein